MAKISEERKAAYYGGLLIIGIGFILFISSFFSASDAMNTPFGETPGFFKRAVWGMILLIVGGIVTSVGAMGAAGSGLVLDPEKAREDLKPYNEAAGKMINDVIENIEVVDKLTGASSDKGKEIIKVRCLNCQALNDEDAKFCKTCGKEI